MFYRKIVEDVTDFKYKKKAILKSVFFSFLKGINNFCNQLWLSDMYSQ